MSKINFIIFYSIGILIILFPYNLLSISENNIYYIDCLIKTIYFLIVLFVCLRYKYIKINSLTKEWYFLLPFVITLGNNLYVVLLFKNINITNDISYLYNDAILFLGVSLFEEIIFRGLMFRSILNKTKKVILSIILSSIVFGLMHFININESGIFNTSLQVLYSTCTGALFCFIYWYSNNLFLAIIAHFIFNYCNQTLYLYLYKGDYTKEFYIFAIVNIIITLIYTLFLYQRKKTTNKLTLSSFE